jgi:uncharacterized membrane protein
LDGGHKIHYETFFETKENRVVDVNESEKESSHTQTHPQGQKFNVRKCKTTRLDESYRLVTTVVVLNSHYGKIHNIFLTTITAAVQEVFCFNHRNVVAQH